MRKYGIWGVFLLTNLTALFCLFNPWTEDWRTAGIVLLVAEAILTVVVYVPVVLYQRFAKKRLWGESLTVAMDALMNMLSGVP